MIFDSLYENRAPVSKTKGVSRLNTRLSFYAYEIRKLQYCRSKALFLSRKSSKLISEAELYQLCFDLEMIHFEYVFSFSGSVCNNAISSKVLDLRAVTTV
jgi:hypothetical protein